MGLGIQTKFLKLIGREEQIGASTGLLVLNWIVQRIFRQNSSVPFSVHHTSNIRGYKNMRLGSKVSFSMTVSGSVNIYASDNTILEIGEGTIFANNVCIRTANHDFMDRNKYTLGNVKIGKNCWLGHGAVILPSVTLGENVTVGANSVVTKSFPDNCVIAGVPAKIVKEF